MNRAVLRHPWYYANLDFIRHGLGGSVYIIVLLSVKDRLPN